MVERSPRGGGDGVEGAGEAEPDAWRRWTICRRPLRRRFSLVVTIHGLHSRGKEEPLFSSLL